MSVRVRGYCVSWAGLYIAAKIGRDLVGRIVLSKTVSGLHEQPVSFRWVVRL